LYYDVYKHLLILICILVVQKQPLYTIDFNMKRLSIYLFLLNLTFFIACSKKGPQSFHAGQDFYEAFKKAIEKSIEEEDRQKQAIEILDAFKDELTNFDQYLDKFQNENESIILDYNSTEEDLLKVAKGLNEERSVFYKKMLDLHTQLVELTTEEEWENLTKKLKTNLFNY